MALEETCSRCGAPLGREAHGGFCPKCVFEEMVRMRSSELEQVHGDSIERESGPGEAETVKLHEFSEFGTRIGAYELQEEIGRGGMGIIFKAKQLSLGRTVALKLLIAGHFADAEFIRRFRTEATAAGMLKHPNIVGIHEIGIHERQHYIAMDYVHGQNLAQLCGAQPLCAQRAARYVRIIAEAIHYAHERGILHRDLKPANIVLDANDQPHITDFGLAKRLNESGLSLGGTYFSVGMTVTGQMLGSPNYMPPEQASEGLGKIGRQSDIYSLGAILYHLITGRPPFVGETLSNLLHQVLEIDPSSPRMMNSSVPRDLETICLKCLQKKPSHRYHTAQELADDLERFLNNHPIHARPVSRVERLWRSCRRNPGLSVTIALLLLFILLVAVGSPIAAFRINQERLRAERSEAATRDSLYAAQMNLAQQAWEQSNIGRLRSLLDEARSYPERGFEWFYWLNRQNQEVSTIHTPGKNVHPQFDAVAFPGPSGWC